MKDEFLERLRNRPEPARPKEPLPDRVCPRCLGRVPTAGGSYLTGHSRKDRSIEICSGCAAHEGWLTAQGVDLSGLPWPVELPASFRQ